ncbi:MAG: hypothetical protein ACI9H8_000179 [Lysobacterales bacterium]|jgi:hypothetical protein
MACSAGSENIGPIDGQAQWELKLGITADFPLTLIATAIVFPIVFSINGAYKRREAALGDYASIKPHSKAIFFATRDWLEDPGEDVLDQVRSLLGNLLASCKTLFSSPVSELRKNEGEVYRSFSEMSKFIKNQLRGNGLATGEVSRCNQYLSKMFTSFEHAKHVYQYRTPRTLGTFSSVFITVLPVLYGPYFAFKASQYSSEVIYVIPVLFSIVLVSLSNIQEHLEIPFDGVGEDDITFNVDEFVDRLYH